MQAEPGIIKGITDEPVKFCILLLLYLIFISCPEGLNRVDRFAFDLNGEGSKI